MKIIYFSISIIIVHIVFLFMVDRNLSAGDLDEQYSRARDAVYNQKMSPREIHLLISKGLKTIGTIPNEQEKLYWMARLESLAGYMELHQTKDLKSAEIYSPSIFGGKPQKGIRIMQEALEMPDLDKGDLFNIFSGIGIAYSRLKKYDKAKLYLARSLELFPDNFYANEEIRKLD
jgi:tetratricopeptide (TPR) repeat protein